MVTPENHQALLLAMAALVADMQIRTALSVVHIAYWSPVALSLRTMHGWRILYDCMDDWDGFPNIGEQLLSEEKDPDCPGRPGDRFRRVALPQVVRP
nr:hypothetical protein GCM10020185_63850 [Pseudomonas brassicacearum subsp. brassicacearum]